MRDPYEVSVECFTSDGVAVLRSRRAPAGPWRSGGAFDEFGSVSVGKILLVTRVYLW